MSRTVESEQMLMRIFIGESDKYEGKPLFEVLLEFFRKRDFPGATVLRGVAGFGAHARIHTERILRLSLDLPIIVEVVAPEKRVQEVLPELDHMIDAGLVTLERAHVILYRPPGTAADRPAADG
jgi:PII-like signaling protein